MIWGVDLPLTQEFLAQMMGVRRTSVTEVAVAMQKAGMISYGRGRLHIIDPPQVQMKARECHEDVQSHRKESLIGREPIRTRRKLQVTKKASFQRECCSHLATGRAPALTKQGTGDC